MHKFRLLLLSLMVFISVLYAGDKENGEGNSGLFKRPIRRASVDASQPKTEDSKALAEEVKSLSERLKFVYDFARGCEDKIKKSEERVYGRIDTSQEQQNQRVGELDKKMADLTTSAIQKAGSIEEKLNSRIIETVPNDLEPVVDGLRSQLEELFKKTATYEQQLQTVASQEELQQIKAGLDDTVGEISNAVKLLPTYVRTQVANGIGGLIEEVKRYPGEHYVTKKDVEVKLGQKASQLELDAVQKDIENIKKIQRQIPTERNTRGFVRQTDADRTAYSFGQQLDDKVERTALNAYATKDDIKGVVKQEDGNPVVRQKDLDAKAFATAEQIQEVKALIPSVDDLAKKGHVDETAKALEEQLGNKADRSDLDRYAKKDDIQRLMSQDTYQELVTQHAQLQEQFKVLEKNSPKELLKSFAKQGALGCVAYQLSPHMASLLRSLKLENSYVDLETVAVPLTTGTISLLARLAQEMYDNPQNVSLKEVVIESVLDGGASAGVMGLKYMFFDDEMNEWFDQLPKQSQTARYGGSYAGLRLLIALCKPSIY